MKILHVNIKDAYGGAAIAVRRLHHQLKKKGVSSKVLVINKYLNDQEVYEAFRFNTRNLFEKINLYNFLRNKYFRKKQQNYLNVEKARNVASNNLNELSLVEKALQRFDDHIMHLHWVASYMNFKEAALKGRKIIWTIHDCNPFTGFCHYVETCEKYKTGCEHCPLLKNPSSHDLSFQNFQKKLALYAKLDIHVVCPSNWLADRARESKLLGKFEISVIGNGLDTTIFSPIEKLVAKEALHLNTDKKLILFGAINAVANPLKGYNYLLNALKLLRKEKNNFQLAVFGSDDGEQIEGFDTKYLGHIADEKFLALHYSAADVMVVPSIQETFGQTITEAMACGTPVVAFDNSGPKDIIDHLKNGYLAKCFDTEDIAAGIAWCIEQNTAGDLSLKSRAKIKESFAIEYIAAKYIELYKRIN